MCTQKGADLTTLELCRGSSRDDEAALEKNVGLGEESISGSKRAIIDWIFL